MNRGLKRKAERATEDNEHIQVTNLDPMNRGLKLKQNSVQFSNRPSYKPRPDE